MFYFPSSMNEIPDYIKDVHIKLNKNDSYSFYIAEIEIS